MPTTSIKKPYVRKRMKNTKERQELGKTIDVIVSGGPVTSQPEGFQILVDRGRVSKQSTGSDEGKEIMKRLILSQGDPKLEPKISLG